MNAPLEFETLTDCDPRWLEQPVSAIATHISREYHEFTRDQLPLIMDLAVRLTSIPDQGWGRSLPGIVRLLTELRDAVETHAWTEDDLLFPALVAHEHPNVLATNVTPEHLLRLVETLSQEHVEIRALLGELESVTEGFRVPQGAPGEFGDLLRLTQELTGSLSEELDLEDHCLLPRARRLAAF